MKKTCFPSILLAAFVLACDEMLLPPQPENEPVANFDLLWNDFDLLYGGFQVKRIDWNAIYDEHRQDISHQSSNQELYDAMTGMLDHLNDNHVFLFPTDLSLEPYTSGIVGRMKTFTDFRLSVVETNYIDDLKKHEVSIRSGWIGKDIGYIHFSNFNESMGTYKNQMEELMHRFRHADGLIVDIRDNEGGYDQAGILVAGYFATSRQRAFQFKLRNGPDHNDFTKWRTYFVAPEGKRQFTENVIILTHRFTISAAETFVLAAKRFSHIQVVGDTTSGAFSDVVRRELPNGWAYGVSVGDWRDHAGTSWEGVGFPPDIVVQNSPDDLDQGRDEVLEMAITRLNRD